MRKEDETGRASSRMPRPVATRSATYAYAFDSSSKLAASGWATYPNVRGVYKQANAVEEKNARHARVPTITSQDATARRECVACETQAAIGLI